MSKEKIYWLINSQENKKYNYTTWYRCAGIENFIEKVEEKNEIVAIIFEDNNIGLILDSIPEERLKDEKIGAIDNYDDNGALKI